MKKVQSLFEGVEGVGYWIQGTIDRFDSYRSSYYLAALLVIILDIISALRIRVVYLYYTHTFMTAWEIDGICAGLVIMNYLIATHRHFGLEAMYYRIDKSNSHIAWRQIRKGIALSGVILLVLITLAHDVAAVLWNFLFIQTTGRISVALDAWVVASVVAGLVLVPFLIGHHMIAVKERMPEQDQAFFTTQKAAIQRRMQLRALYQLEREMRRRTPAEVLGQTFIEDMQRSMTGAPLSVPETQVRLVEQPRIVAPLLRPDVVTGQFAAILPEETADPKEMGE